MPVVRNTRVNETEPIVCTPDEAITKWAHRAIGNFLVEKEFRLDG